MNGIKIAHTTVALSFAYLIFSSTIAYAVDIITMKNGDVYRGEIIEQKFNQYIQIRSTNGDEKRLKWKEIALTQKGDEALAETTVTEKKPTTTQIEPTPASSQSDTVRASKNYLAGLIGPTFVTQGEKGTVTTFGVRGGTEFLNHETYKPSLGLIFAITSRDQVVSSSKLTTTTSLIMVEAIAHAIANTPFYFGARAGIAMLTISGTVSGVKFSTETGTSFAYAPVVGCLFPFGEKFSLGLDLSYISGEAGNITVGTTAVPYTSFKAISSLMSFHFEF